MAVELGEGDVLEGKYRIRHLIGEGGMGAVYEAEHATLHVPVAIKVLHPTDAEDPQMIARFEAEARSAAGIRHRNIVEVTDFGLTPDRRPFFVMELLAGESLAERLDRRHTLGEREVVEIGDQILSGLGSAHRKGVVHRDLKPENIFLCRDEDSHESVKILDFGIAKILAGTRASPVHDEGDRPVTRQGIALGTPGYMAPETVSGRAEIDARADIFSVGVLLYECLCGRRPFVGATPHDVLVSTVSKPVPRPTAINPEISEPMERMILIALAKNPDDRFYDTDELISNLTAAAVGRVPDSARQCKTRVGLPSLAPPPSAQALGPAGDRLSEKKVPATVNLDHLSGNSNPPRPASALELHKASTGNVPGARTAPRQRYTLPFSPLAALALVAIGAAFYYFFLHGDPLEVEPEGDPNLRRLVQPEPAAADHSDHTFADTDPHNAAAPPGPAPIVPEQVTIWVDVKPRDAILSLDGRPITDRPITVPGSSEPVAVTISAPGYRKQAIEIVPDRERTLKAILKKKSRRRGGSR
ncbi:MAG: serine/threonine-protein kinase [Polyangia bacterium]